MSNAGGVGFLSPSLLYRSVVVMKQVTTQGEPSRPRTVATGSDRNSLLRPSPAKQLKPIRSEVVQFLVVAGIVEAAASASGACRLVWPRFLVGRVILGVRSMLILGL